MLENVLAIKGSGKDLYIWDKLHQLGVPARFIWGTEDALESPYQGCQR